jgi:hypothetical protein
MIKKNYSKTSMDLETLPPLNYSFQSCASLHQTSEKPLRKFSTYHQFKSTKLPSLLFTFPQVFLQRILIELSNRI